MTAVLSRIGAAMDTRTPMVHTSGGNETRVLFDVTLLKLTEFDERKGVLEVSAWLNLWWNDERANYNGVLEFGPNWRTSYHRLSIASKSVWTPDAHPFYNTETTLVDADVAVYDSNTSDGLNMFWSRPATFKIGCGIDLTDFPFDQNLCTLVIGPWVPVYYFGAHSTLATMSRQDVLLSEEWTMRPVALTEQVVTYKSGDFREVHYTIELTRSSHYYVMNIVLPMCLVVIASGLTMWLPIEGGSGERLGYSSTILLTILAAIFFTAERRPASQDDTWLDSFQAYCVFLTVIPVIESVLIVWLQHQFEKAAVGFKGDPAPGSVDGTASETPSITMDASPQLSHVSHTPSRRRLSRITTADLEFTSSMLTRANFSTMIIVYFFGNLPTLDRCLFGRHNAEKLSPRILDRWVRHIHSVLVFALGVRILLKIPSGRASFSQGSAMVLSFPVIVLALFGFVSAILFVFMIGARIWWLRARAKALEPSDEDMFDKRVAV